jgi:hypothetical protein
LNGGGVNDFGQSHLCLSPVPLTLRWVLKSWKDINDLVLIKFQTGGGTVRFEIIEFINLILNKEELTRQWKEPPL